MTWPTLVGKLEGLDSVRQHIRECDEPALSRDDPLKPLERRVVRGDSEPTLQRFEFALWRVHAQVFRIDRVVKG